MSTRTLALAAALVAAAACRAHTKPALVSAPIAPGREWVSEVNRDHPLAGRIWDVRAKAFVDEAALTAAVAAADFVLLGETHDNADHHLLQARLVRAVTATGKRPALALEMLQRDQQPTVDAALARSPGDPDAFASAVSWKTSRWPAFALYRPVFAASFEAGLPVIAANLARPEMSAIMKTGRGALPAGLVPMLARDEPLPEAVQRAWRDEMSESHCGELPDAMLDPLVLAQRARDAQLAERTLSAGERGAILIAGTGHVRTDRGATPHLVRDAPGRKVVSVAFVEAQREKAEPEAYAKDLGATELPFDYVVFTPGAERDDPCEGLRERSRKAKATTSAAR